MAHEIFNRDLTISANNITPWHGLGTVWPGTLSPDEAFHQVALDWTVGKYSVFTRMADMPFDEAFGQLITANAARGTATLGELLADIGYDIPVEGKYATVREDIRVPLGIVGEDYEVFQNSEGFQLLKALLDGGDVEVETAGTLRNNRVVYVCVKMHRDLTVEGDRHFPYVLFTWSHDGTTAVRIVPTAVRVVCANTLRMALSGAKMSWTSSHTRNIGNRAAQARETLKLAWKYYDAFEDEVRKLIDTTVEELTFEKVLFDMVPDPTKDRNGDVSQRALTNAQTKRGEIRKIYYHSDHVGEYKGTAWGVVQAFNSHDLWNGRVQGGEGKRLERQATRILSGDTMTNTNRVRDLILASA